MVIMMRYKSWKNPHSISNDDNNYYIYKPCKTPACVSPGGSNSPTNSMVASAALETSKAFVQDEKN